MCIARVVSRIEARAVHGFRCVLDGRTNLYFPKLGGMSLDTKERQKFFGLRSQRACGFCRLRNGRSAARVGSANSEVVRLSKRQHQAVATPSPVTVPPASQDTASTATKFMAKKLTTPLSYTEGWQGKTYPMRQGKPGVWGSRLLSSKARVTRHELLTLANMSTIGHQGT